MSRIALGIIMIPILVAGYFMLDPGPQKQETIQTKPISLAAYSPEAVYGDLGGEAISIEAYYASVEQARLEAEAKAAAEAAAAEAAKKAASAPHPSVASGSRPPAGGHSDAWWAGVAQCEQGGRNDPYFGYFSFMDGSAGGKSWEEQVAMGNALLARVASESPAWAPSCVAAGYAASPSG